MTATSSTGNSRIPVRRISRQESLLRIGESATATGSTQSPPTTNASSPSKTQRRKSTSGLPQQSATAIRPLSNLTQTNPAAPQPPAVKRKSGASNALAKKSADQLIQPEVFVHKPPHRHKVKRVWLKQGFLNGVSSDDDEDYMYVQGGDSLRLSCAYQNQSALAALSGDESVMESTVLLEADSLDPRSTPPHKRKYNRADSDDVDLSDISVFCADIRRLLCKRPSFCTICSLFILIAVITGLSSLSFNVTRPLQFQFKNITNVYADKSMFYMELDFTIDNPNLNLIQLNQNNFEVDLNVFGRKVTPQPTPPEDDKGDDGSKLPANRYENEVFIGRIDQHKMFTFSNDTAWYNSTAQFDFQLPRLEKSGEAVNLLVKHLSDTSRAFLGILDRYIIIVRGSWSYPLSLGKHETFWFCIEQTMEAHSPPINLDMHGYRASNSTQMPLRKGFGNIRHCAL